MMIGKSPPQSRPRIRSFDKKHGCAAKTAHPTCITAEVNTVIKRGLSHEGLKTVACLTMLLDHIGAILVISIIRQANGPVSVELAWLYYILRCIGRTAFPIFCFQLVEGAFHTSHPSKYAMRLALGAVLAEIPFDLAFYGGPTWEHTNVMVTLLLGFAMVRGMQRANGLWKLPIILPFYMAANLLHTDYSGKGILIIAMFALTREMKHRKLLQLLGLILLSNNRAYHIRNIPIYTDRCKLLSLLPIFAYNGRKRSRSKALQWGFYLFYPVHILLLYLLKNLLF